MWREVLIIGCELPLCHHGHIIVLDLGMEELIRMGTRFYLLFFVDDGGAL